MHKEPAIPRQLDVESHLPARPLRPVSVVLCHRLSLPSVTQGADMASGQPVEVLG